MTRAISRTVLRQMLAKAKRKLAAARRELKAGYWEEATTHAYYAAFHAITAVLATERLEFRSHAQTIGAFNSRFVRTGTFEKESAKILHRLFGNRQLADYDWTFVGDLESAKKDVQDSAALVAQCRDFIKQFELDPTSTSTSNSSKTALPKTASAKKPKGERA
ncbi:MAG: HEPN domain-containing protein [Lentisphaerae bacterium]|jgi:uncharacterized protein (UPF0332 family)|nr:HEPN domain-containing protein [Lentisphaerota bacterium]